MLANKVLKRLMQGLLILLAVSIAIFSFYQWEDDQPSSLVAGKNHLTHVVNAKRLPLWGANFKTYSYGLSLLGRTHVHSQLRPAILEAYKILETSALKTTWIYGESGWKNGGNFWPHRTHRNGLSVDFMVPVVDITSKIRTSLPHSILNAWGYDIRFNKNGTYKNIIIDFEAMIQHLDALNIVCSKHNIRIKRVIFDPPLLTHLKKSSNYHLISKIPFMPEKVWFPHDSHYHIDFEILN